MQPGVGHYGVFNGTRWRTEIQPRIREFIRTIQYKRLSGDVFAGAPLRSAKETPIAVADWKKKANGHINGANGEHVPAGE